MAIELSPRLSAALRVAPPHAEQAVRTGDEPLRRHPVLRYTSAEEAESYRRIMRVLFLEHQAFGLRLRPTQVAERLATRYGTRMDPALLEDRLAQLGREHAVLDGQRIPAIRAALDRLAAELEDADPDGLRLRTDLERALAELEALHAGALTFMSSLSALIRRSERVDEESFERSKGSIVEHLEVFRRDRRRWTHEVLAAIERIERAASA